MNQHDQIEPTTVEAAQQWEAPQLVVAEVSTATLSGGANNVDSTTFSS